VIADTRSQTECTMPYMYDVYIRVESYPDSSLTPTKLWCTHPSVRLSFPG